MTTVDGNTWSNVLGICDEYQVEGWTPVFAGMTEMGGFQAFCPCRGGRARSVGRRWRAGERGTPLRQHFVLPPPLPGEDQRSVRHQLANGRQVAEKLVQQIDIVSARLGHLVARLVWG